MNRAITAITITAIGAILLAWAPSAAYAGGGFSSPATVLEGWGCGITEEIGGPGVTFDTHSVVNKKNTKITCHFTGLTPQDPSLISRGFVCGTFAGATTNSMMVVDENGDGMLRCSIHTNNP